MKRQEQEMESKKMMRRDSKVMVTRLWGGVTSLEEKVSTVDEIRQEERQNLEVMKQKSEKPIAPRAFAKENCAGNAFKGPLDAALFSRWGDGGVAGSNRRACFFCIAPYLPLQGGVEPVRERGKKSRHWRWAIQVSLKLLPPT